MTDDARRERRLARARHAFWALGRHRGNTKEAARDQGIAETTLRKRLAAYCEEYGYLTPFEAAWRHVPVGETEQIGISGAERASNHQI